MCGLFLLQKSTALERSVAQVLGGVREISFQFLCFSDKAIESKAMVYNKTVSDYAPYTVITIWTSLGTIILKQCNL